MTCYNSNMRGGGSTFLPLAFISFSQTIMNFRAPLFVSDEIDYDVFQLLTEAQKSKLLTWALILDVKVKDMLKDAKFMCEQINDQSKEVFLFGILPNCKMYGCISPDGSSHT